MAVPSDAEDWQAVETLDDFASYLSLLSADVEGADVRDAGSFLEAFNAWLNDCYLRPGAPFAELRPEPSWREFARMLCVTRSYA